MWVVLSIENEQIIQTALRWRYWIFLSCVYRRHGLFPSLNVFLMLKFQNFTAGILTLFVCSLISHLIFKQEVLEINIELFCGKWHYFFFLLFHSSFSKWSIFPIWIPIQSCLHSRRIRLNPYLASTLLVDNSIPIVYLHSYRISSFLSSSMWYSLCSSLSTFLSSFVSFI